MYAILSAAQFCPKQLLEYSGTRVLNSSTCSISTHKSPRTSMNDSAFGCCISDIKVINSSLISETETEIPTTETITVCYLILSLPVTLARGDSSPARPLPVSSA